MTIIDYGSMFRQQDDIIRHVREMEARNRHALAMLRILEAERAAKARPQIGCEGHWIEGEVVHD